MINFRNNLLFCFLVCVFSLLCFNLVSAKNVITKLSQQNDTTLNSSVDLHLTASTAPLTGNINIKSNDAWLFFDNVSPSEVIANQLGKIKINSVNASASGSSQNVRVAIYGNGAVVIPNGNTTNSVAATIYTEKNYGGSSKELAIHTYYKDNTLGSDFNDKVKSFKLKRGYMATFAENANGTGYSRVFIADDEDIEMAQMPDLLEGKVSFIRVFKWEYPSKKGVCGSSDPYVKMTRATWWYNWGAGSSGGANYEFVPIKQNAGGNFNTINNKQNVSHLLGYNEPDHVEQSNVTVEKAIEEWPKMLESGLRLGTPACTDFNWLYKFMSECERLNYRVDFVAVHAYWGGKSPESWYTDLKRIHDRTGRPIWITEWNNGANWTSETWPDEYWTTNEKGEQVRVRPYTEASAQKQLDELKEILHVLDTCSFIERHSIYNWVEQARMIVLNADDSNRTLTKAGEYFRDCPSQIAFNRQKEVIPTFTVVVPTLNYILQPDNIHADLVWPGDFNHGVVSKYIIEKKLDAEPDFTELASIDHIVAEESEVVNQTYNIEIIPHAQYRIKVKYHMGTTVSAVLAESGYSNVIVPEKDVLINSTTQLQGEVLSYARLVLNWNALEKARSYEIQRSTSSTGPFTTIASDIQDLTYMDSLLNSKTTYYYKIAGVNYAGTGVYSDVFSLTTKELTLPAPMANIIVVSGDSTVSFTWDNVYDVATIVKRSESFDGLYEEIGEVVYGNMFVDMDVENGKTCYYTLIAKNEKGESVDNQIYEATPEKGRYAYWKFDENANEKAFDFWGGYHAELKNTSWVTGKFNSAVLFSGASDSYAQLPAGIVSNLNDFTISAWINIKTLPEEEAYIFSFGSDEKKLMSLSLQQDKVCYKIAGSKGNGIYNFSYSFPINEWVHIALTHSDKFLILYINGESVSRSLTNLKPSTMGVTQNNYLAKSQPFEEIPNLNFIMDDFRIYNYGVNAGNVLEIMNDKPITDELECIKAQETDAVAFYPNPVQNILTVKSINDQVVVSLVEIYDSLGQKIMKKAVTEEGCIDMAALSNGLYIVRVITNKGNVSKQILKN